MPKLHNLAEATKALLPFVQRVNTLLGSDTSLQRIAPLMTAAGNPHDKVKIIHIAGTSGKTSTAYFAAALLRTTGKHVGLTVSPHVDSVTERVQINGQPISEAEFCDELGQFLDIVATLDEQPSYFELLYSLSFWVFAKRGVDYAVVETGMGGSWDPTNIARQPDKVCVITDIGYDHMHILGNTLPEIAAQKAGIIHPGNQVFMYHQTGEIDAVFVARAAEQGASIHWTDEATERQRWQLPFAADMADYQQRNWLLAELASSFVIERDGLLAPATEALAATQRLQVPGRMDHQEVEGKTIVMDGAHNAQKMAAFLDSFRHLHPDNRPPVLLALKEGKEPVEIATQMAELTDHLIITTFETSQDMPARSIDPETLAPLFRDAGVGTVETIPDQQAAYQALLTAAQPIGIVTGSFYLLSQLRETMP